MSCNCCEKVSILSDVAAAVTGSMRVLLQQLLAQLRAPAQLPLCLRVVSFLRRVDVFTEPELRLKFLG